MAVAGREQDLGDRSPATSSVALRGGNILTPQGFQRRDLVLMGGRIIAMPIGDSEPVWPVDDVHLLDGDMVVPGLIDGHVHFLGGGGAAGFSSRGPELTLTDFTLNGITTAVGMPGLDMVSRNAEGLLAKARGLRAEGLSAFIFVGGFHRPLPSLTGAAWRDTYLLDAVLGVKVAMCESRASAWANPSGAEELDELLRRLAWAAGAANKRTVLHVHFGDRLAEYPALAELVAHAPSPGSVVITHCNRSRAHLERAVELAAMGAVIDLTTLLSPATGRAEALSASAAFDYLSRHDVDPRQITMSTDGNGDPPRRTATGWGPYRKHVDTLLEQVRALVHEGGLDWAQALAPVTVNVADVLGLPGKGRLTPGADADLLVLTPTAEVRDVYAGGVRVVSRGEPAVKGRYEST